MTVAVLAAKSTVTDFTPATPFSAFVTVTGHMAHVMFSMLNVVFWTAAACSGAACAASGEIVGAESRPAEPTAAAPRARSAEHTSALQSLMRITYAVLGLTKISNANIRWSITHASSHTATQATYQCSKY